MSNFQQKIVNHESMAHIWGSGCGGAGRINRNCSRGSSMMASLDKDFFSFLDKEFKSDVINMLKH